MTQHKNLFICKMIIAIGLLNFAAFWVMAVCLGGDAVNGAIRNGHYFLMSHGRYTEVTQQIFNYSKYHVYSVWITHPAALVAAYWYLKLKKQSQGKIT